MAAAKTKLLDFRKLDKKWQAAWKRQKLYETHPDTKRKKFFTSLIIPYVNGNAHIGHSYTYTRTDVAARFRRLQGYNVLLASGFHATGEPILGTIERLKKGDQSQIGTFKLFGATDRDLEQFKKKGPLYVAEFWAQKIEESFQAIGFSVDWRRKFTLSITPQFSRFVEWQYQTLKKKGFVTQGTHPVIWCPKDQSPTGDHDRLEGEGESPQDYVLLKFAYKEYLLPAATLRPETIYGVTNLWVHPDGAYVVLRVNDEKWIVSRYAAEKLQDQLRGATIEGEFDIRTLIGQRVSEPLGNREIPILPASFVDPDMGTGVVMSVPSHAPYDWVALKELIDRNELEQYGVTKNDVEPIAVVKTQGLGEHPAQDLAHEMGITTIKQEKDLEEATGTLYKKEFHQGVLNENCGIWAGKPVNTVKEEMIVDFIEKGIADTMWEPTGKVVCRCTTRCHVKILENQWFLKYSDEHWKDDVRRHLSRMSILPPEARANFENTIEWLKDKACARKSGLGTRMPWDSAWLIETLSDSTIYMAYYTIAHLITTNKIPPAKLTDAVFDFIFLGKGDPALLAKGVKLDKKILQQMRDEFEYFYPMDLRNSAKDLIQNHLTFYLFHHAALWPERLWPRSISVNGYVNVEGEKMSKSKGNIIPLVDLIKEFGADLVRINIACSSEGIDDADWRAEGIKGYRSRLEFIHELARDILKAKSTEQRNVDDFLLRHTQKNLRAAIGAYEQMKFRTAGQHALFEPTNDLRWYLRRVGGLPHANRKVLKEVLGHIAQLIAPLTPHFAEEIWSLLGNKTSIFRSRFPAVPEVIDESAERAEHVLQQTIGDIDAIRKLAQLDRPKKITIFVAENWKFRVHAHVLRNKDKDVGAITREIMSSGEYGQATVGFIQTLAKRINELTPVLPRSVQLRLLTEAKVFLQEELQLDVEIVDAEKSSHPKSKQASPQKFGILLE